ncbi:MAG: DUF1592 domain-containing protein [Verrucomicrobiales bacterium]|nr:DUF1592 domain-containing protein [Verrucomicrobiales bacterium]
MTDRIVVPIAFLASAWVAVGAATDSPSLQKLDQEYGAATHPILKQFCLDCHSTEKHKGDLDLERFKSFNDILKDPKVWQGVIEQISLNEMPPKEKPQPTPAQREQLLRWIGDALDEAAKARAGDPGPVVLRRLSNAEYTYTLRDLTGVNSLDPAKEFPGDSASGEGFMNVGNSLVMSPSLVTKYLDAAKEVARHAVLLPDGLRFSPSTSQRDWSEEALAAIRAFYARFSDSGGATSVNLQGIQFDTNAGGRLPLEKYLLATLAEREALRSGKKTLAQVAAERGLVTKYLSLLWQALEGTESSLLLDVVRSQWKTGVPGDAAAITKSIGEWQQALWRFTTVGHIGKRDGPKAWQIPVSPLSTGREIRLKLNAPADQKEITLYLSTSDAGDGSQHDYAVWENPRLSVPGRPDLALRDLRAATQVLTRDREQFFSNVSRCLAAAADWDASPNKLPLEQQAAKHGVDPSLLGAWLDALGIGSAEATIDSHLKSKMESAQGYDFIKGWTGADALSVLANSSSQHVRVPGNMKPHSVVVHPSPKLRVAVGWRSPVAGKVHIEGQVQHAHPECGNGVAWSLELRRGQTRQRLAVGTAQGAKEVKVGPIDALQVQPGDLLSMIISPRDGNHSCDTTAVDFTIRDGSKTWDLGQEVSPNILAGNPHSDSHGHDAVWHFYSEPDNGKGADSVLPTGSLLARWQTAPDTLTKNQLAAEVQTLLQSGGAGVAKDSPDSQLYRQLTSLSGPLISVARKALITQNSDPSPLTAGYGLDPNLFGKHPTGGTLKPTSLSVKAPSVLEVKLPADLVAGCEFVATGTLDPVAGIDGSVQMQASLTKPSLRAGPAASSAKEQGAKSTWSEGDRPLVFDSPILVAEGGQARERIERDFSSFRDLFPIALCYTKIVPVDEVVTLTLYYREDEALRRLLLDDQQAAELDRLWDELHYVSHDALKLVDAFEQLWQFATQDADPSAFTPMREPIQKRAAEFKKRLVETEPKHLEAVVRFAESAYRRPLAEAEGQELRELYGKLRQQELPHDEAVRFTLARLLVSPAFLYRTEKPGPGTEPGPVGNDELATRLSYFLWASAPDATLREAAARKRLQSPEALVAEMRRMIKDPRVRRLATEFACAWLHVYDFDQLSEKSERHFPTFNGLRGAMYEETIRFFTDLFQRGGSVLEILDADHAFLNGELAKHYGVPADKFGSGSDWRRVDGMKAYARGGILGQATTLAKMSGASRTSPILRGNWVAEVLLGDKLPKPPKNVPQLPEDEATETLTMRQLTEKHSSDPKCIGCHRRIDPYGYSLEGFDTIGRHRDRDLGGRALDTSVKTMEGAAFEGVEGLRSYLLNQRRDGFLKQFCRKLLGYSLGRSVMLSDTPLINEMRQQLKANDYRVSAALETIVKSRQFREIRGREAAYEE